MLRCLPFPTSQSLLLSFSSRFVSFFCFSFCFFPSWLLKLSSSLHVFLFVQHIRSYFSFLLFLTRYIFKCILLCGSICPRRRNFFHNKFLSFFFLFPFYLILTFLYRAPFCISAFLFVPATLFVALVFHFFFLNVKKSSSFVRVCFLGIFSLLSQGVHARCYFFVFFPLLRRGRSEDSQIFILCNLAM